MNLIETGEAVRADGTRVFFEKFIVNQPFQQQQNNPDEIVTPQPMIIGKSGRTAVGRRKAYKPPPSGLSKKFPCRYNLADNVRCLWSFETPAKRRRHENTHYEVGSFKCQLCNTYIKHMYNMYVHWRTVCSSFKLYLDYKDINSTPSQLKRIVVAQMTRTNQFDGFANFGGMIFLPSEQYLKDTSDRAELTYTNSCHTCGLSVPLKFYKAHALAHRGFLRVDAPMMDRFMCHLCGCCFKVQGDLQLHWRSNCAELKAYIGSANSITDNQLAAIVFLLMQICVSFHHINELGVESDEFLKTLATAEQNLADLNGKTTLFHFNKGVAPLEDNDIFDYSKHEPILKAPDRELKNILETEHDALNLLTVHDRINLFALRCPSFYSSGKEWYRIKKPGTNEFERRVLKYNNQNTIVNTYGLTKDLIPAGLIVDEKWRNNRDVHCRRCDLYFASQGRADLHHKFYHLSQAGQCLLCDDKNGTFDGLIDHWRRSCEIIKGCFHSEDLRTIYPARLRQFVFSITETDFSSDVEVMKKQIAGLRAEVLNTQSLHNTTLPRETLMKLRRKLPKAPSILLNTPPVFENCLFCGNVLLDKLMFRHLVDNHGFDPNLEIEVRHLLNKEQKLQKVERRMNLEMLKGTSTSSNDINLPVHEFEHNVHTARLVSEMLRYGTQDQDDEMFEKKLFEKKVQLISPQKPATQNIEINRRATRSETKNVPEPSLKNRHPPYLQTQPISHDQTEQVVMDNNYVSPTDYHVYDGEHETTEFGYAQGGNVIEDELYCDERAPADFLSPTSRRMVPQAEHKIANIPSTSREDVMIDGMLLEDEEEYIHEDYDREYIEQVNNTFVVRPSHNAPVQAWKPSTGNQAPVNQKIYIGGQTQGNAFGSQPVKTVQPSTAPTYKMMKTPVANKTNHSQMRIIGPPTKISTLPTRQNPIKRQEPAVVFRTNTIDPRKRYNFASQTINRDVRIAQNPFSTQYNRGPCVLAKTCTPTPSVPAVSRLKPVMDKTLSLEQEHLMQQISENPSKPIGEVLKPRYVVRRGNQILKPPTAPAGTIRNVVTLKQLPQSSNMKTRPDIDMACNETLPKPRMQSNPIRNVSQPTVRQTVPSHVNRNLAVSTARELRVAPTSSTVLTKPITPKKAVNTNSGNLKPVSRLTQPSFTLPRKRTKYEPGMVVTAETFGGWVPSHNTQSLRTGLSNMDDVLAMKEEEQFGEDDYKMCKITLVEPKGADELGPLYADGYEEEEEYFPRSMITHVVRDGAIVEDEIDENPL